MHVSVPEKKRGSFNNQPIQGKVFEMKFEEKPDPYQDL